MKICGIYLIRNRISGKGYVGQAKDVFKRWRGHLKQVREGSDMIVHRAIRKLGSEGFDFLLLQMCPEDQLNDREVYWVRVLDTFGKRGYNATTGGDFGRVVSDRMRHKLSVMRKGVPRSPETVRKMALAATGRVVSKETRLRMSLAGRGKPRTESQLVATRKSNSKHKSKPVRCLTTGQVHRNLHEAALWATGRISGRGRISRVCRGILCSTLGHKWEFVKNPLDTSLLPT